MVADIVAPSGGIVSFIDDPSQSRLILCTPPRDARAAHTPPMRRLSEGYVRWSRRTEQSFRRAAARTSPGWNRNQKRDIRRRSRRAPGVRASAGRPQRSLAIPHRRRHPPPSLHSGALLKGGSDWSRRTVQSCKRIGPRKSLWRESSRRVCGRSVSGRAVAGVAR
jgi:hypothetical protein